MVRSLGAGPGGERRGDEQPECQCGIGRLAAPGRDQALNRRRDGNTVHLAPVLIQPMAADDVAEAVGRTAAGSPLNGTVEVAGPRQYRLVELIRMALNARGIQLEVVADSQARYFGALLGERTLVPWGDAMLFETLFEDWLREPVLQK